MTAAAIRFILADRQGSQDEVEPEGIAQWPKHELALTRLLFMAAYQGSDEVNLSA
jgi:hypothetical protein